MATESRVADFFLCCSLLGAARVSCVAAQDISSPPFSVGAETALRPAPLCPRPPQLRIILRRSPGACLVADDAVSLLRQLCVPAVVAMAAAAAAAAAAASCEPS